MYGITGEYTDLCSAHNIVTVLVGQALALRQNKYLLDWTRIRERDRFIK